MELRINRRLIQKGLLLSATFVLAACSNDTPQETTTKAPESSPAATTVANSAEETTKDPYAEEKSEAKDPYAEEKSEAKDPYAEEKSEAKDPYAEEKSEAKDPYAEEKSEAKDPYAEEKSEAKDPYAEEKSEAKDPYAEEKSKAKDPYAEEKSEAKDPYAEEKSEAKDPYAEEKSEAKDPYAEEKSKAKDPYAEEKSEAKDPYAEEAAKQEKSKKYDFDYTEVTDGVTKFGVVENPDGGPKISFSLESGINILTEEVEGKTLYFKDLNNNGKLDTFEDWREDTETRSAALAEVLSIEQIAGLMLFSGHQRDQAAGLTDEQKTFLEQDNLRNVLHAGPNNVEDSVKWTNQMQAFVEGLGSEEEPIIPVNISSDPRSAAGDVVGYNADGADISRWPSNLGLAATFNADYMKQFSSMSSEEYRAMGITMALGPQIDLATEPRWLRVNGTFGESIDLATDFTEAYVNSSQSTFGENGEDLGWGNDSVAVMIKHAPGDGAGESGRESHLFPGKYEVFPGGNFEQHLELFVKGGLKVDGKAGQTSAMMMNYSIMLDKDGNPLFGDEAVGTAYNKNIVDLFRVDNNYDGVLVTDWGVTRFDKEKIRSMGTAWGMSDATVEERHFRVLVSGLDMFGGNNDKAPVLAAYDMWKEANEKGELEQTADERFRQSAKRIVRNFFNLGLFENPYLDLEHSKSVVASKDKVEAGYQAQLDSVVMVKNTGETIKAKEAAALKEMTVYIPSTIQHPADSLFGPAEQVNKPTLDIESAKQIFGKVLTDEEIKNDEGVVTGYKQPESLEDVDLVIVGMTSPNNGHNFSWAGVEEDNKTYYPLSLQYREYIADGENVRKESIGGDILADGTKENRSYFGNKSKVTNEYDLDALLNAVELVEKSGKDIPVVVAMKADNPVIMSEFEDKVDAIVVGFQVSDRALLDIIAGKQEPKGLLPVQFPANMDTVEANQEDVPFDLDVYKDSEGNAYDFGYGLNYNGVIQDERTEMYKK
ncbi:glycoside hydrolase family 3 C-terminal domain-containing protein [Aerococcaceae bacterium zg-BR9]|uniref:glycoside hydrolase family 3 N-terminal domain-containing protein n=1 Tax=Aerococcaceae bacterium zg-1292 TaxID=2774330 RepID=UPI004062CC92|nr:glycoside hydrolase family 3 C-terminal domain-containing protein [Aerococcaceae bacterium zg-BR9]